MSVEAFFKLKEIDSLSRMKASFEKQMSEQEDRVSKLNVRRQDNISQTAKLKQDLISMHNASAGIDEKLKTASQQKQRVADLGGDEEKINKFQAEIESLENEGFALLEATEKIEQEIAEHKEFLAGLERTIAEIQSEASAELEISQKEISTLDTRITYLLNELPEDFKKLFEKVSAKKLVHGPFTRVDQGSCFFCRSKISRLEESEIDMQKNLKTCPQCSRIFLPYGA